MRILLVENDENLANHLAEMLSQHHYRVDTAQNSQTAWEMIHCIHYDLVLMNVQSTRPDQMRLCCRSQDYSQQIPVMLMTGQDLVTTSFAGRQQDRSNLAVKSLDVQELLTRIRVLSRQFDEPTLVLANGRIRLNSALREISCDGKPVALSRKEFLLLELLLRHPHRLFSGTEIVDRLWSFDQLPTEDTVRSHIRRIRQKLAGVGARDLIQTLYGHGYRINPSYLDGESHPASSAISQPNRVLEEMPESVRGRL